RQRLVGVRRQEALALGDGALVLAELAIHLREVDQKLGPRRKRVAELELVQRRAPTAARVLLLAGAIVAARHVLLRRWLGAAARAPRHQQDETRNQSHRPVLQHASLALIYCDARGRPTSEGLVAALLEIREYSLRCSLLTRPNSTRPHASRYDQ